MNPEVKALWTEALRSGNYKQGRGQLHYRGEAGELFCCLGVLCDLAVKAGVVLPVDFAPTKVRYEGLDLPPTIRDWAGLNRASPHVVVPGHGDDSLANLNDDRWTFDQIADLIAVAL